MKKYPKFNIGDWVEYTPRNFNDYSLHRNYKYLVTKVEEKGIHLADVRYPKYPYPEELFTLSTRPIIGEEGATELLKSLGYTITPPKPKLSGEAVIWRYKDGPVLNGSLCITFGDRWDNEFSHKENKILIARVPWTEE